MGSKLSRIIDFIITRVLIFLAASVFTRFYIKSLLISIIIALLVTAVISVLAEFVLKKRKLKKHMNKERERLMTDSINQFIYNDNSFTIDFFAAMLTPRHKVDKDNGFLIIDESIALFCKISLSKLNPDTLCNFISQARKAALRKIVILSHITDKDTHSVIKLFPDFRIDIYDDEKIFCMMERYSAYPPALIKVSPQKARFRDILPIIFNKSRYKSFLSSALILSLGSIFLPYTIYYAIMTAILITMAFLSYKEIFTKRNKHVETLL